MAEQQPREQQTSPQPEPLRWHNLRRNEAVAIAVAALLVVAGAGVYYLLKPPAPVIEQSGAAILAKLDVNRASATELVVIPGVGESTARAIIAEREARGRFTSLDDFLARTPRLKRDKLKDFGKHLEFGE